MEQFETSEMNEWEFIRDYLYLLRSWALLILLSGLFTGTIAYIYSIKITPMYEASTRLLISIPPILGSQDSSAIINAQALTSTYAGMMVDQPVLQGVIEKLNLQITSDELKPFVTVKIVSNTQLIQVTVQDPNPLQAADIANTLAVVFTDRIREMQSQRYASTLNDLTQQIAEMELQLSETSAAIDRGINANQNVELEARLTEYQRLYSNLVTNYEQVRLAEAQTSTYFFVSEPARVSTTPVNNKTTRNTLQGVAVGLLVAVGGVVVVNRLDDTIKNPDEIRLRFKLPILGMIASNKTPEGKLICQIEPRSPVAESFRSLRTNLTYASVDMPLRRILVTSATPLEGKTTIASNLAIVMAQGEKRVVLIDADMRRPKIHRRFGLLQRIGLSDLFVRTSDLFDGVLQASKVPRLSIVTSGRLPPNPSELLASQMMDRILENLSKDHDLILIDTPPLLLVTDAAALSTKVDGVLMVVKPGFTKLATFKQSLEQLRAVGARVLGVVLNGVNPRNRKYGYYYNRYYSKYPNYYDADGEKHIKEGRGKQVKKMRD